MPKPLEEEVETPNTETVTPHFRLDRLIVRKAVFEEITRAPREEGEQRPARPNVGIQINATIQRAAEPPRAIVTLAVELHPDLRWQPYRLEVTVAGAFSGENVNTEQFDQFCRMGVAPILFPYVREIAHRLTMDASAGMIRLDPINVAEMLSKAQWGNVAIPEGATASIEH